MEETDRQNELSKTLINMAESMGEDNFLEWANNLIKARIEQQKKKEIIEQQLEEERKIQTQKQREVEREKYLHPIEDSKYTIEIEYINGWKVIHKIPIMTDEEREEKKREIVLGLYNLLCNK